MKMQWHINNPIETSAGIVKSGMAGSGPPLVLVHGWPWSSFSWHRIIPTLAKDHTVYWYDMPGYGSSEKDENQLTSLDVQGEILVEVLSHWKIAKPKIIAHDIGGAVALRAHLLHACQFDRLILMNVVALSPWGSDFFDHVGRHVEAFLGLPLHIHKAIVQSYISGALANDLTADDFDALVAPWLSDEGSKSFYRQFAQADECYTAEIEPLFEKIECSVKILWGENDPWIPLKRGEKLNTLIPQATFEIIANTGHLPQLERPEIVTSKVRKFLTKPP